MILEEKIKILERFNETGEKLTGKTEFEGYPIGQWAIQIRSSVNRMREGKNSRKTNFSAEQVDRLSKLGILDRKIDSRLDEKINMLIQWMEKYPKAIIAPRVSEDILKEYSNNEGEYLAITEEYEKMQKYYDYIRARKNQGKLTGEQRLKCKEGNVGGVFGYPTEIEQLAQKHGKSEGMIADIIAEYGTMDKFKELYRNGQLETRAFDLADSMFRKVIDIDMKPNNSNYDKLYLAITRGNRKNIVDLYSSENLKTVLGELKPEERDLIEKRFGLIENGVTKTLEALAIELNVGAERVRQREAKTLSKLRHPDRFKRFAYGLNETEMLTDEERNLVAGLIDNLFSSDIIYSNSSYNLSGEKKEDILRAFDFVRNMDGIIATRKQQKEEEIRAELENIVAGGAVSSELQERILSTRIEDLEISLRTSNCLNRAGINTLGDIAALSIEELGEVKNFGRRSMEEIAQNLSKYGITLPEKKQGDKSEDKQGEEAEYRQADRLEEAVENEREGSLEDKLGEEPEHKQDDSPEAKLGGELEHGQADRPEDKLGEELEYGQADKPADKLEEELEYGQGDRQGDTLEEEPVYRQGDSLEGIKELPDENELEQQTTELEEQANEGNRAVLRARRDELQAECDQLELKIKEARELLASYNKLLVGDTTKSTTQGETPEFKGE